MKNKYFKLTNLMKMINSYMVFSICLAALIDPNQGRLYQKLERRKYLVPIDFYKSRDPFDAIDFKKCLHSCDNDFRCSVVTIKNESCQFFIGGVVKKDNLDKTEIYVVQLKSKQTFRKIINPPIKYFFTVK